MKKIETTRTAGGTRVQARDAAIQLGRLHSCPVVLGSETPSVETFHEVEKERYRFILMGGTKLLRATRMKVGRGWGSQRPAGVVDVVDMRTAPRMGARRHDFRGTALWSRQYRGGGGAGGSLRKQARQRLADRMPRLRLHVWMQELQYESRAAPAIEEPGLPRLQSARNRSPVLPRMRQQAAAVVGAWDRGGGGDSETAVSG